MTLSPLTASFQKVEKILCLKFITEMSQQYSNPRLLNSEIATNHIILSFSGLAYLQLTKRSPSILHAGQRRVSHRNNLFWAAILQWRLRSEAHVLLAKAPKECTYLTQGGVFLPLHFVTFTSSKHVFYKTDHVNLEYQRIWLKPCHKDVLSASLLKDLYDLLLNYCFIKNCRK